jgi:hypothetical protein
MLAAYHERPVSRTEQIRIEGHLDVPDAALSW